jgi:hypothetical protein
MDKERTQAGLRLIARGLEELAAALDDAPEAAEDERTARVIRDWGRRGLTRRQTSDLFKTHGFSPQVTGGWARGDWIKLDQDGLRYLTAKSHEWLSGRPESSDQPSPATPTDG